MQHHDPGMTTQTHPNPTFRILARMLTAALVFGCLGPLVGYVLIFLGWIAISPADFGAVMLAFVLSVIWVLPLLFAYTAFWPALLTGLIAGVLSLMRTRAAIYYPAITMIGAALCYGWFSLFPQDAIFKDNPWYYAYLGAGSAAACAWLVRVMTPKAERA